MKTLKIFGFALVFTSSVFSTSAFAMTDCDALVSSLISQAGGCPHDKCTFEVKEGRLVEKNGGKVFRADNTTEMNGVSVADADSNGVSHLRLVNGKDSTLGLKMVTVDGKGNKTTSQYGFSRPGGGKCVHEQTQKMSGDDIVLNTEFDREFCEVAENAFAKMEPSQAASCGDAMKALVEKYEERGNSLAGRREVFRASSAVTKATSKSVAHAFMAGGGAKIVEALRQRDSCMKATLEINSARYPKIRIDPFDDTNFTPNPDKRAWPLDEEISFGTKKGHRKIRTKN